LAQLTRHLLCVVLIEIKLLGDLAVREVEPHKIQAQYPHPQGLMMAGKDRVRQIVQAALAGLTLVALTLGLGVIAPLLGNIDTFAMGTRSTLWPM
jgi:hypothetical protein